MIISDSNEWVAENFVMSEFYSGSPDAPAEHFLDGRLITACQTIRDWFGVPVRITSTYRTESHNSMVGGSSSSQHLYGLAVDFQFTENNDENLAELHRHIKLGGDLAYQLADSGIRGFGFYNTFAHIDVRTQDGSGDSIAHGDFVTWGSSPFDILSGVGEEGFLAVGKDNWKAICVIGLLLMA